MMKTVCEKDLCAGCMACMDICPKQAIEIKDSMFSYNAVIDESRCINCNACHSVCQENTLSVLMKPTFWKQGWAKDEQIREKSSSGGLASAIEQAFIKNGGVVCSCAVQDGKFSFSLVDKETDINRFSGSKYVKSNPQGTYKMMAKKVEEGGKVLFVGLPCQVAAVKNYVKNEENLYTVDLICHGTPSPQILERFLGDYGIKLSDVQDIQFRVKTKYGLRHDKTSFSVPTVIDNYLTTFLNSTTCTENCYSCKYAKLSRVGDITLGDSWGSELEKEIQQKGVSLLLCQNDKGKELLTQADICLLDVDLNRAIEYNHQLAHPPVKPKQRNLFLKEISNNRKFRYAMLRCYPKRYLKNIVKTILYKLNLQSTGG